MRTFFIYSIGVGSKAVAERRGVLQANNPGEAAKEWTRRQRFPAGCRRREIRLHIAEDLDFEWAVVVVRVKRHWVKDHFDMQREHKFAVMKEFRNDPFDTQGISLRYWM